MCLFLHCKCLYFSFFTCTSQPQRLSHTSILICFALLFRLLARSTSSITTLITLTPHNTRTVSLTHSRHPTACLRYQARLLRLPRLGEWQACEHAASEHCCLPAQSQLYTSTGRQGSGAPPRLTFCLCPVSMAVLWESG